MVIQRVQSFIKSYVPEIPEDAVLGTLKSAAYSFTVCIIVTDGNYVAGAKSAMFAVLATVTYALGIVFFARLSRYFSTQLEEKSDLTKTLESVFIASGITYLVSEMLGSKIAPMISIVATVVPYAIRNPTPQTPLFGVIIV